VHHACWYSFCYSLQHDEGWIATWKSKYWLPWCVARTRPVKNLVNLYQEFTSYKLRYVCTWDEVGRLLFDVRLRLCVWFIRLLDAGLR
jgi:hypothetical protein